MHALLLWHKLKFLPIFGLLGIDYGIPFDKIPGLPDSGKQSFTFSISQALNGGFN